MQQNVYKIATSLLCNSGDPKLLLNLTLVMPQGNCWESLPMFMVHISSKKLLLKQD